MKTLVHKWCVSVHGTTDIKIPHELEIVSVGNQKGSLVVWASGNPNSLELEERDSIRITSIHTGEECDGISVCGKFVGTVLFANDSYVVHVFAESI